MKQSRQLAYYYRNKKQIAKKRTEKRFLKKMQKKIVELQQMREKYNAIMDGLLTIREARVTK